MTTLVMPVGIQRRRVKGWRLPENTVCVDRSTRFGNLYSVEQYGRTEALHMFKDKLLWALDHVHKSNASMLADEKHFHWIAQHLGDLTGKNLACWCPLELPCHRNILLIASNPPTALLKGSK